MVAVAPLHAGTVAVTATPTPLPLLTPAPAASAGIGTPALVIYPFDVQGGMDKKIGIAMAQITAQQISAAGGINVSPVPEDVMRVNFLANARNLKADYYISGYVTPVGEIAAVVVQLVAVDSGIIIYSQTAQVQTVADVASQALVERDAILVKRASGKPSERDPNQGNAGADVNQRRQHEDRRHQRHRRLGVRQARESLTEAERRTRRHAAAETGARRDRRARFGTGEPRGRPDQRDQLSVYRAQSLLRRADDRRNRQRREVCRFDLRIQSQQHDRDRRASSEDRSPAAIIPRRRSRSRSRFYTCFGAQLDQQVGTGDTIDKAINAAAVTLYATAPPGQHQD